MSSSKPVVDKKSRGALVFDASYVALVHTVFASTAFITALFFGCLLHYKKITRNDVAQYPDEWWPSVSATIGDWYPERNLFQILIALTSGPRFALVIFQYYLTRSSTSSLPMLVFLSGLLRTLSCGGWVYVTSSDDHDVHDILMITYIVCNLPWMFGGIALTSNTNSMALQRRRLIATAFFVSIVPLVYFFIQHKVHRIPGAYTHYSFFEWALIAFDIMYDSVSGLDFQEANLQVLIGSSLTVTESGVMHSAAVLQEDSSTPRSEPKLTTQFAKLSSVDSPSEPAETNGSLRSWKTIRLEIPVDWRPATGFVSDVYLSYIFWSIFTSLTPSLFYFSVWELGIAGAELALLSTLSPILLSIPPFLSWVNTRGGQTTMHALSFLGLVAFMLDDPMHRLLVVTFATAVLVIREAVSWTGVAGYGVGYQGLLMGLGLIVSSLSKHANHSNNPVWPIINQDSGGYNKTGLFLAFMFLYEFHTRPTYGYQQEKSKKVAPTVQPPAVASGERNWLLSAIPLGSLIFSLHCLLSDSSTIIAWSWTGFVDRKPRGPQPNLHGSITLIAQSLGLLVAILLASRKSNIVTHPLWFIYGACSSFVMYCYRDWLGYTGGLNLAVFLMSIIPQILEGAASASAGRVAKTYFTAWLVTCLLDLADVWTVAYAFVPGGVFLRERTNVVLFSQMICLGLAFDWPRMKKKQIPANISVVAGSFSRILLALICISSVLVSLYRWPSTSPRPHHPGARIVTAGIWTLHFGIDNEGRDSQRRVRDLISDMQLDVVGLLETDLHRIVFGNRDLTRVITEELGYYVDLGPGPNSHTWGAALLSKFPIINSTHHLLPSPRGELAPAIEAWLDVYGTELLVVVAHNGQEEDALDRELQSRELARIMSQSYPHPTIFLGYVVSKPLAAQPAPYDILVTDGRMFDVDHEDWDRWCEYIFYRGLYRTAYARVSRGVVTDTELQTAQFVLPRHGFGVTNDTQEARTLRSFKEDLPQDHWFPMEYYGNDRGGGKNSHYYHVFFTVRTNFSCLP